MTVLLVIVWLLCGYIAAGISRKSNVDEWRRLNPRVTESGAFLREPQEYDRKNAALGWFLMILGVISLCIMLFFAWVDRLENSRWRIGFMWWNPFMWFSRNSRGAK